MLQMWSKHKILNVSKNLFLENPELKMFCINHIVNYSNINLYNLLRVITIAM